MRTELYYSSVQIIVILLGIFIAAASHLSLGLSARRLARTNAAMPQRAGYCRRRVIGSDQDHRVPSMPSPCLPAPPVRLTQCYPSLLGAAGPGIPAAPFIRDGAATRRTRRGTDSRFAYSREAHSNYWRRWNSVPSTVHPFTYPSMPSSLSPARWRPVTHSSPA